MGDLKPLGSEKLKADDKLKRILELTYYKENKNKSNTTDKPELVKEGMNGVYGIVKEKDGYYVKKGLNEGTLEYIGGIFMKNKNRFSSYAEALKRLELLKGQEELQEATKYVLKTASPAAPKSEEPAPAPAMSDAPPAPSAEAPTEERPEGDAPAEPMDMGGEESPEESPMPDEEGGEESGADNAPEHMKEVQRLSGKLGQAIREVNDKMESDDVKYVINMLLSAVDIEKLSEEDKEEIVDRFEPKEEEGFSGGSEDEEPSYDEAPELDGEDVDQKPEEEVSEIDDPIASLEELVDTNFDLGEDDEEPSISKGKNLSRLMRSDNDFHKDWYTDNEERVSDSDINSDDYDEEEFDDHDAFMSKHSDVSHDLKHKSHFDRYKPVKVRTKRNDDFDITPELSEINESIKTTLSKYFE